MRRRGLGARGSGLIARGLFGSLHGYRRVWLRQDVGAGLVLAAMLIPQGMAYAEAAGMPAVTGLYATMLPIVAYAALGSSRQIVVGPDSALAAMIAAALLPLIAGSDPIRYAALAGLLALLTGLICGAAGLTRIGFFADFLSTPVLIGYINGLAVTIIVSQLPKVLGFSVPGETPLAQVRDLFTNLDKTQPVSVLLGATALGVILVLRRWAPRLPGVLVAVVGATLAVALFSLDHHGVKILGSVPSGLPRLSLPNVGWGDLATLAPAAAGIALVAFADTTVTSRTFADRNGYEVDADRDLIGLGAANLAAGLCGGFNVSSSSSRTAVAEAAGGRTQLAGLIAAGLVALVLIFGARLLKPLPQAALGAVVLSAAVALFDVTALRRFLRERRSEFYVALVTWLGVMFIGILPGILLAVLFSLSNVLRRATRPPAAVLGWLDGPGAWQSLRRYPEAKTFPGLIVYRFEAPLFFANAERFRDEVRRLVAAAEPPVEWFVFDASPTVVSGRSGGASAATRPATSAGIPVRGSVELSAAIPCAP